jgi:hypothetical protein
VVLSGQLIGLIFKDKEHGTDKWSFRDNLSVPSSRVKNMGPISGPETAWNYHYSLRNSPEELGSYLPRCGSLKSRMCHKIYCYVIVLFECDLISRKLSLIAPLRTHINQNYLHRLLVCTSQAIQFASTREINSWMPNTEIMVVYGNSHTTSDFLC